MREQAVNRRSKHFGQQRIGKSSLYRHGAKDLGNLVKLRELYQFASGKFVLNDNRGDDRDTGVGARKKPQHGHVVGLGLNIRDESPAGAEAFEGAPNLMVPGRQHPACVLISLREWASGGVLRRTNDGNWLPRQQLPPAYELSGAVYAFWRDSLRDPARPILSGQIAAVILLVGIVAAIGLTMRKRPETKYQDPSRQVAVKAADRLRVIKMDAEEKAR